VKRFAPRFDILYLGLPETPPGHLETAGPLGWALRTIQKADAARPEFLATLTRAFQSLGSLLGPEWRELAGFLVALATYRRPEEERADFQSIFRRVARAHRRETELHTMTRTIAEALIDEGLEKGLERGREAAYRQMLLRLGTVRFGRPTAAQSARLSRIADVERLEKLPELLLEAESWDDLLKTRPPTRSKSISGNGRRPSRRSGKRSRPKRQTQD
jgi:hypothetical protein